ncbi:MAG: fumarylacetoacetate hydrolase family protein [Bacteroidetes bacterium]|nr:fumarylacetoacetate hydrolase family protein [Bacteroidota bacterium]
MKLVSYLNEGHDQLAFLVDGLLFDCDLMHPELPNSMNMFLHYWDDMYPIAQQVDAAIKSGRINADRGVPADELNLLAPVPFPTSCRDAFAFREHASATRKNQQAPLTALYDQFPVFYFSNHHSIQGPGEIKCMPDHLEELDFELEAAIVICKHGRNIPAEEADAYIGGLMIFNDFSARKLQLEEMQLHLGPAKGKDFATAIGPCLVTIDELEQYEVPATSGHTGKNWNLEMKCAVNGEQVSGGNLSEMNWTFAEIIERCSYGADLQPGDVIGSGTVGTGCFLENNITAKLNDPNATAQWLKEGDTIEMEIQGIGILTNSIVKEESSFSILSKKKI